jgi:hypothetical protein
LAAAARTPGARNKVLAPQPFCFGGGTAPGYLLMPHAFYSTYGGGARTWVAYEGYCGNGVRAPRVCFYDHTTKQWSGTYRLPAHNLSNDSHGNPSIVQDVNGQVHAFYGCHVTGYAFHASTVNANDVTQWGPNEITAGGIPTEYPSGVYLSSAVGGAFPQSLVQILRYFDQTNNIFAIGINTACPNSDGSTTSSNHTWSGNLEIINPFVNGSTTGRMFYTGAVAVGGTSIHLIGTLANFGNTQNSDIYYFIITPATTSTGAVTYIDGTHSASWSGASTPGITGATLSNYRVVAIAANTPNYTLESQSFVRDAAGNSHIIYSDGSAYTDGSMIVYHTGWFGSSWSTRVPLGKLNSWNYGNLAVTQGPNGGIMAFWLDTGDSQTGAAIRMAYRSSGSGGTWSRPKVVHRLPGTGQNLGSLLPVTGWGNATSHPDIRMVWFTGSPSDSDTAPFNGRNVGFAYGDNGFLQAPASRLSAQRLQFCSTLYSGGAWSTSNNNLTITASTSVSGANNAVATVGVLVGQTCYMEFLCNDNYWQRTVSGASSGTSSHIRLAVNSIAGLVVGDSITVSGVTGVTGANGTFTISATGATYVEYAVTFSGSYTGGGVVLDNSKNGNIAVGLVSPYFRTLGGTPYLGVSSLSIGYWSGNYASSALGLAYPFGGATVNMPNFTKGDILGMAVANLASGALVWFNKNGGIWNNAAIGSQNPATFTGGFSGGTGTHEWLPAVELEDPSIASPSIATGFTMVPGPAGWTYTPPSGYGAIGQVA